MAYRFHNVTLKRLHDDCSSRPPDGKAIRHLLKMLDTFQAKDAVSSRMIDLLCSKVSAIERKNGAPKRGRNKTAKRL